ncbi:unnamed protein product [Diplocarpon coronariae]|nr:hypothetical protein JHW43_003373 [Diplocarpon mali]
MATPMVTDLIHVRYTGDPKLIAECLQEFFPEATYPGVTCTYEEPDEGEKWKVTVPKYLTDVRRAAPLPRRPEDGDPEALPRGILRRAVDALPWSLAPLQEVRDLPEPMERRWWWRGLYGPQDLDADEAPQKAEQAEQASLHQTLPLPCRNPSRPPNHPFSCAAPFRAAAGAV